MVASSSRTAPVPSSSEYYTEHKSTSTREEENNIYIRIKTTVALKVKRSETIKYVKALVCERYGVPENHQELFFDGERLMDSQRLVECGVQTDSTVHLVLQSIARFKIFVKLPSSQGTIEIEEKSGDTIRNIKAMIQANKMIELDQFTLVYDGQLLEEESTLASLHIKNESTLHMISAPKDDISISVQAPLGKTVNLKTRALFTVSDVKTIVGSIIGVSLSDQNLVYAGKLLLDCKKLAFYDIRDESVLKITPRSFMMLVENCNGNTTSVYVTQCDTVEEVKRKVFLKLEVSMMAFGFYRLSFAGKLLDEGRDLASYNILKGSTLSLVLSPSAVHSWSFSD